MTSGLPSRPGRYNKFRFLPKSQGHNPLLMGRRGALHDSNGNCARSSIFKILQTFNLYDGPKWQQKITFLPIFSCVKISNRYFSSSSSSSSVYLASQSCHLCLDPSSRGHPIEVTSNDLVADMIYFCIQPLINPSALTNAQQAKCKFLLGVTQRSRYHCLVLNVSDLKK